MLEEIVSFVLARGRDEAAAAVRAHDLLLKVTVLRKQGHNPASSLCASPSNPRFRPQYEEQVALTILASSADCIQRLSGAANASPHVKQQRL